MCPPDQVFRTFQSHLRRRDFPRLCLRQNLIESIIDRCYPSVDIFLCVAMSSMIDVNDTTRVNQLIRTIQNSRIGQSHVIFLGQQLIVGCTCDDGRIKIWNRPFIEHSAKRTWSKNVAVAKE